MQYGQIVSPDGHGLKRLTSLLQSLFVCAARGIGLNEEQTWRGAFEQGKEALCPLG